MGLYLDPKFFPELADDRSFCRLAEFDRSAQGAHALDASSIIQNLGRKKPVTTPVEVQGFQSNSRHRVPFRYTVGLRHGDRGGNGRQAVQGRMTT